MLGLAVNICLFQQKVAQGPQKHFCLMRWLLVASYNSHDDPNTTHENDPNMRPEQLG